MNDGIKRAVPEEQVAESCKDCQCGSEPMEIKIQIPEAVAATQFVSVPVAEFAGYITTCRDMELLKASEAWYGGLDPEKLLKLINWCEEQKAKGNG